MTKNVKLTKAFLDFWKAPMDSKLGGMGGRLCANGKPFFYYEDPPVVEGEGFRGKDIAADPTKVPIYDLSTAPDPKNVPESELSNYIIRYEGSNATPPTADIFCYGCGEGDTITISNAEAAKWLSPNTVMEE